MTKSHVPSTKPVTRKQIGNLLDKVGQRLERNKNLKSFPFEHAVKKHSPAMIGEMAAVAVKYHDAVGEIICVNRKVRPVYPDWVDKPMHPELEKVGPADFDMSDVEQWLHDGQKTGVVKGQVIYDHLKTNDMLKTCFGVQELQTIQGKGIEFFRKHFAGKAVFGWRSVVLHRGGRLYVPCLIEYGFEVKLYWDWLDSDWYDYDPALRFRK